MAMETFSIREYTARIRSVDAGKCWPFAGGDEGSLPPMDCRKYRWWSSELEFVRSAADGCADAVAAENVAAGGTAAGGVEDESLATVAGKVKMRPPKKRSIVELFAVAPQIKAAGDGNSDYDESEDGEEEDEVKGDVFKEAEVGNGEDELKKEVAEAPRKQKEESVEILMKKKDKKMNWVKNKSKLRKKKHQHPQQKNKMKVSKSGIRVKHKEKVRKVSLSSPIDLSRSVLGSVLKRCGNELKNQDASKKPASIKSLPKQKKLKPTRSSTLQFKKQQGKSTVQGILKKRTMLTSFEKMDTANSSQNGALSKPHRPRQPDKHVSFSGKDDILGHEKTCSVMELPHMQSLCKVFSDVLAASSVTDRSSKDDKQPSSMDETGVVNADESIVVPASSSEKPNQSLHDQRQLDDSQNLRATNASVLTDLQTNRDMEKTAFGHSVDLNHSLPSCSNLSILEPCSLLAASNHLCSSSSVLRSIPKVRFDSESGNSLGSNPSKSHIVRTSLSPSADYVSGTSVISSMSSIASSGLQISSPHLTMNKGKNDGQSCQLVDPRNNISSFITQSQPFYDTSQTVNKIHSSMVSQKQLPHRIVECGTSMLRTDPAGISQDKYTGRNFIGLPLNSQGELIKLHSCGNLRFDQLSEVQNMLLGSRNGFSMQNIIEPVKSIDHLKTKEKFPAAEIFLKEKISFFPEQPLCKGQSSNASITTRLGFPEFPDMNHTVQCQETAREYDLEQRPTTKDSCHGCRENSELQKYNEREMIPLKVNSGSSFQSGIQPTMRLMGKDVAVGKSNKECQRLEDGKVWTDKEIIAEQNTALRMPEKSVLKWHSQQEPFAHPATETSRNSLEILAENKISNVSSFYQMNTVDPIVNHAHLDFGSHWMSRNVPLASRNHLSRLDPFISLPTETLLNKVPMLPENHFSAESVKMFSQLPVTSSNPYDACQHMLFNCTHCKHGGNLSYNATSTRSPAFMNPDYGNHVQQVFTQFPPHNLPQWLLEATQQKKSQNISPYSGPISNHHPYIISETNQFPLSSPYPSSVITFPAYDSSASPMCLPNLSMASSLASHPVIPAFPLINSNSVMITNNRDKWKSRDGLKSRSTHFRGIDQVKKLRKRPLSKAEQLMKPAKKSNLMVLDDSDFPTGSTARESSYGCTQYASGAAECCPCGDKVVGMNNNEKDSFVNTSGLGSLKLDNAPRAGPIKLSAGAKHILKPSQNMDVDNSRPIFSTIPFAIGSNSGKVPVPQKKSAKIYQF